MLNRLHYSVPINCSLNVTQKCNLRYLHCSAGVGTSTVQNMTAKQLMRLVQHLIEDVEAFQGSGF